MAGFYDPPSIKTIREETQTSVVLTGGEVVPAIIGTSLGKTQAVAAYEATMGASATYDIPDLRPAGPPTAITAIRSTLQGGIRYAATTDYVFDDDAQTIAWESVALASPFITAITDVTAASSSLDPDTTYYYVVTALKVLNLTGPVTGETGASNEIEGQPIASTSRLKLSWNPVAGASGYKIYRSEISGNYTGSALLTTVASGFTTTYTDSGTATSAGSPPGVLVYARVVAGSDTPTTLTPGDVAAFAVDGVTNTITFSGTQPSITATGITYPVTPGVGTDTLVIKITDDAGSYTSTVTFAHSSTTEAAAIIAINAVLTAGNASDASGQIKITADAAGSNSIVQIVGGTALALFGFSATTSTGTGVLTDFNHVTTAKIVAAAGVASQLSGATFTTDASTGRLAITNNTGGTAHTLQPGASANTLLDFATTLVAGSDATAGTALRRPALNGELFYVDYQYVSLDHFNPKKFTQLSLLIAEYGLGSNLAIGGTLIMGTAGRGNGASQCVAVSVPDDTIEAYQTALDFLLKRKDVTLVVPLTVVDGINDATKQHCIDASSVDHKRERRAVLGTPIGTVVGDEDMADSAVYYARQLDNERAILVHPWAWMRVQASDGTVTETEMDGWVAAAAQAGRIASLDDRATSPTTKQVLGLSKLGIDLDETDENILGGAGVCVLTVEDGNIICRDGVTTSLDDQAASRIQIGLTDDLLRQTLRAQFKNFRGRKLQPALLKLVVRRTLRILTLFKKLLLISDFNPASVSAIQDPDILTNINVGFSYRPMFDVRIIVFTYSLDLTTGTIA